MSTQTGAITLLRLLLYLVNRDSFIIIACDGIWDVLTNEEAVDFVACELNIHG